MAQKGVWEERVSSAIARLVEEINGIGDEGARQAAAVYTIMRLAVELQVPRHVVVSALEIAKHAIIAAVMGEAAAGETDSYAYIN